MSSNKLYSLKIAEEKYVLRILSTKHTLAARQNEIDAHEIGAALGIAPEIVYKDKDFKFIVMRFINGHILTRNDLQNPTVIAYLGNMIGKLHSYQGQFQNIRTQNDRVRKHCERAISKDNAFPSIYKNLYEDFILSGSIINKNDLVFLMPISMLQIFYSTKMGVSTLLIGHRQLGITAIPIWDTLVCLMA